VDGTLIDSYAVIVSSLQETLEELGVHSDREEIHRYVITYSVSAFIRKMTEETEILSLRTGEIPPKKC